jgi:predicted nucleotidyltransferase
MHCVVEDNRQAIGAFCRRFDVRRLEVFDSAACGVDFQADVSDVDFLVEFDPTSCLPPLNDFFDLQAE